MLFSNTSEVIHDRRPIDEVQPLSNDEYRVGGCTALLDAIGGAISHIRNVHKYARKEDVPEKTVVVITTDGLENASRRYSYQKVKKMVEEQTREYGWEFLFLGANMDAIKAAGSFGIDEDHAVRFHSDSVGTTLNYKVVSEAVASFRRSSRPLDKAWKREIEEDYEARK